MGHIVSETMLFKNVNNRWMMDHSLFSVELKTLTLLHSERPKLYVILAFLSARGLTVNIPIFYMKFEFPVS